MFHCISDDKMCPVYRGVLISDALIRGVFPASASSMYDHVRVCPAYMIVLYITMLSATLPHCHFNTHVCHCSVKKDRWCLRTTRVLLSQPLHTVCHSQLCPTHWTHPLYTQTAAPSLVATEKRHAAKGWVWFRYYTAFQFAMREVKGHISTALVVHVI